MNRNNQILAALLVAQVIITAIVLVPRLLPSQTQAAPLLGDVKVADVVGLTIQEKTGASVELAKKDTGWVVPQGGDYAASGDKITAFIGKLIGLQSDPLVTRTAASHQRLQVADDNYVRKIDLKTADGRTQTLFLGTASGGTYVRLGGQDNVYLAHGLNSFEAASDVASWINPTYFSVPQDKIVAATIENAQGHWQLTKNAQNQWVMPGVTDKGTFDPASATSLLGRLSALSMVKPLGKDDQPAYGLSKPSATVTVVVSDTASTKAYTLRIGAKDASGNYLVISSESPYYAAVAAANVDPFVNANLDTFLVKTTPTPAAALGPAPAIALTPTLEATPMAAPTLETPITATPAITPSVTPKPK